MYLRESIAEVVPVTDRSRIEHVSRIALIVMDAAFKPLR